jgi:hypothetical protein
MADMDLYYRPFGAVTGGLLDPPRSGPSPSGAFTVTVRSSQRNGLELYDIEGGLQRVYSVGRQRLADGGVTEEANREGRLVQEQLEDGFQNC